MKARHMRESARTRFKLLFNIISYKINRFVIAVVFTRTGMYIVQAVYLFLIIHHIIKIFNIF